MMAHCVVAAARGWCGTPYQHQASIKGVGCDCLGLLRGIWQELLGPFPLDVPPYSADWGEASGEERLWLGAAGLLEPKDSCDPAAGDVILYRMQKGAVAKHLGIQTQVGTDPKFVHAYSRHVVCENHFSRPWARRVVARFTFPERNI